MGITVPEQGMNTALEIMMKQLLYTDYVRIQAADFPGQAVQSFQCMPDRTVYGTCEQAYVLDRRIDGQKADQGVVVTIRCQIEIVLVLLTLLNG